MKATIITATAAATAVFFSTGAVHAEDCVFEIETIDFEQSDTDRLYACIKDQLAEGYAAEGNSVGLEYRNWQAASTGPAAPGVHGERFLNTFANQIAWELYTQYIFEEGFKMPAGSVLAKESFSLRKDGTPRPGPLFVMTKVDAGEADDFNNWVYSAVQPNGKEMGVKQSFCHDCHRAYVDQDSMGYPDFDVRFETN